MPRGRVKSRNKKGCARKLCVEITDENSFNERKSDAIKDNVGRQSGLLTDKPLDEEMPLAEETPNADLRTLDLLSFVDKPADMCREKENELDPSQSVANQKDFQEQYSRLISEFYSPIKQPKLRCLSLKKRKLLSMAEQNGQEPKRACPELLETKSVKFIAPGLKNFGNSCYLNTVVQVLYYMPKFQSAVSTLAQMAPKLNTSFSKTSDNWMHLKLIENLDKLFNEMNKCREESCYVVDPSNVFGMMELISPNFRSGDQQDVHEFFTCLISALQQAAKEINSRKDEIGKMSDRKSVVSDFVMGMFEGALERVTRCMECENESKTSEKFRDLLLTLSRVQQMPIAFPTKEGYLGGSDKSHPNDQCLSDDDEDDDSSKIFKSLMDIERLHGDNKFYCLQCNHLVEAERMTRFIRCPQVLVFHLQRFAQVQGMAAYAKVTENTGIPLEMNCLEENCSELCHRLKLFAIISHNGYSLTSGHYIAYVDSSVRVDVSTPGQGPRESLVDESCTDGCHIPWLELNDHTVKRLRPEELEKITKARSSSNNPYMLFYARTN